MVTFIWSTNASLPKISYIKSIDVYLICCFFMTFASVIEYAIVSYIHHRFEREKRKFLREQNPNLKKLDSKVSFSLPRLLFNDMRTKSMQSEFLDDSLKSQKPLCNSQTIYDKLHDTVDAVGYMSLKRKAVRTLFLSKNSFLIEIIIIK